jgi:hypothetical protein
VKTYKDTKYNIEITIPDEWYLDKERIPILPSILLLLKLGWVPGVEIAFHNGENEALNISIEKMEPEPTPEFLEMMFNFIARQGNYTQMSYGRIAVSGKDHTCVKYKFCDSIWSKKYMVILNGIGYAITASCLDYEMLTKREPVWDSVVKSLKIT